MIVCVSILIVVSVVCAVFAGIYWTLSALKTDYVMQNRLEDTRNPTGFKDWCKHSEMMCSIWTIAAGILTILSLFLICLE